MAEKPTLYAHHIAAMMVLDKIGGYTTGQIALLAGYEMKGNRAASSGAMLHTLRQLESYGVVERLDTNKPICWKLTSLGSAHKAIVTADPLAPKLPTPMGEEMVTG